MLLLLLLDLLYYCSELFLSGRPVTLFHLTLAEQQKIFWVRSSSCSRIFMAIYRTVVIKMPRRLLSYLNHLWLVLSTICLSSCINTRTFTFIFSVQKKVSKSTDRSCDQMKFIILQSLYSSLICLIIISSPAHLCVYVVTLG